MIVLVRCICILLLATSPLAAAEPQWIWSHGKAATQAEAGECAFRKSFTVEQVEAASLEIAADNRYEVFFNGRHLGSGDAWQVRAKHDIKPLLTPGRNVVAVRAVNDGVDPAGLMVKIEIKPQGKEIVSYSTDDSWKAETKPARGWQRPEFDDSKWANAVSLGEYGKIAPWGAPGRIGTAAPSPPPKNRNTERGLFGFKDGDRLTLVGSAFIERMQNNGYFELELQCAHPDKRISVRNLGWSGDTVWGDARAVFGQRADGFKRLMRDLAQTDPTVILVCYGENEAYAGEDGLLDFRHGFETLLDNLEATGARIVVATPRKHENLGQPLPDQTEYNKSLRMYCDVMKEVAKQRELAFVDWYSTLSDKQLTDNGIHLTPYGYWQIAEKLVSTLGGISWSYYFEFDVKSKSLEAQGVTLLNMHTDGNAYTFECMDRRRGLSAFIFRDRKPKELNLPLFQMSIQTADFHDNKTFGVKGLRPGNYELVSNGHKIMSGRDTSWENGFSTWHVDEKGDPLLNVILEKDFLFFNRHRPQNETYLFLFRKHEQGNNAVEIPQFDPLIDELDKKIAELKKPVKQKYELKRVDK